MNGVDRTNDSRYSLLPANDSQSSKGDNENNLANFNTIHSVHPTSHRGISSTLRFVIIGVGVAVVLAIALAAFLLCKCITSRRNKRRMASFGLKGVETRQVYYPLNVPAPQAHPTAHDPKSYGYYGSGTA